MRTLRRLSPVLSSILLALAFMCLLALPTNAMPLQQRGSISPPFIAEPVIMQSQPLTPTMTPTPTATPKPVTYSDLLETYKSVLETSRNVTSSLQNLLIASGILGLFSGAFLLQRNHKNLEEIRALSDDAKTQLLDRKQEIETLRIEVDTFRAEVEMRVKQADGLKQSLEQLQGQVKEQTQFVDSVDRKAQSANREIQLRLPRLESWAEVDTYAMKLFSSDRRQHQNARSKLLQYSLDNDPIVRRECIRVFGVMPEYPDLFDLTDQGILDRLRQMSVKDKERGVRLEAIEALRKFGTDPDPAKSAA